MVRVTTKDAQGNLVGNTAFILTRANSVSRANASATMSVGSLTVTDAWGNTRNNFQSTSETIYGVTGADGSTTLTLKQDNSTGLRTDLTAKLDTSSSVKATLPVVFTVVTSPDSPKANFWGHILKRWRPPMVQSINAHCCWQSLPTLAGDKSVQRTGKAGYDSPGISRQILL